MVNLSKRLSSVAGMVPKSHVVADIGCDHAHVAIYLIEQELADKVIACDVNKGPLKMAEGNIREYGCEDRIELRLSNGLERIGKGEAESVVIAGMGGPLMLDIIKAAEGKIADVNLILQPQSELRSFREYLRDNGFSILKEDMVFEDGKFYQMMLAKACSSGSLYGGADDFPEGIPEEGLEYGEFLIRNRNKCLFAYLEKEKKQLESVLSGLKQNAKTKTAVERLEEIEHKLYVNRMAMRRL